jgi:hypothetical protein
MSAIVLDIETVGQPVDAIPERALDYLYKSLERDAPEPEDLARRREELIARFGLDPATGKVIVIGLLDVDSATETVFAGDAEKALLAEFWDWLGASEHERYVTFNGKRFDVPFLNVRSAIHGLAPAKVIPAEPLSTRPHFDVREVLEGNDRRRRGSLDFFTAIFGLPSPKTNLDGTKVNDAYAEGRLDDIVQYCLEDCRATAAIYQRLAPLYP